MRSGGRQHAGHTTAPGDHQSAAPGYFRDEPRRGRRVPVLEKVRVEQFPDQNVVLHGVRLDVEGHMGQRDIRQQRVDYQRPSEHHKQLWTVLPDVRRHAVDHELHVELSTQLLRVQQRRCVQCVRQHRHVNPAHGVAAHQHNVCSRSNRLRVRTVQHEPWDSYLRCCESVPGR
jgi:hypothetical protein